MAFTGFTQAGFKVFDLQGFQPRMSAIRGQIRPKLEALGAELLPAVTQAAVSCRCTAPGFLDTEQDSVVSVSALASFPQCCETPISGNTQIGTPFAKSAL